MYLNNNVSTRNVYRLYIFGDMQINEKYIERSPFVPHSNTFTQEVYVSVYLHFLRLFSNLRLHSSLMPIYWNKSAVNLL